MDKVYIVIVNWNGWKDTIECLESVLKSRYDNYQIIVCDNASTDNSVENIKKWAKGEITASYLDKKQIIPCVTPFVEKPIKYIEYSGDDIFKCNLSSDEKLILIKNCENLGFAGGNNIAVKYAYLKNDFKYIWFLNNDTVVENDTLEKLVLNFVEDVGIYGSKLLYYNDPKKLQALGGTYNKIFGISRCITKEEHLNRMKYVIGASMFVSKKFIDEIGLMNEEYFLYFEEIDWAIRARGRYKIACNLSAIVYHKAGATIRSESKLSDYYMIKNRILFTEKYFLSYLPFVYFGLIVTIVKRIKRRQYSRAIMIIGIAISEIKKSFYSLFISLFLLIKVMKI